jgi:hypothetical protein
MVPGKANTIWNGVSDLSKYYGKIDDFFKTTKLIEQLDKGIPANKAIIEAQKWGMDYSMANPGVKYLRQHIMPFASYQYKIAPLIMDTVKNRPWILAKYFTIPFAFREWFKGTNNVNDEEFKRMEKQLPQLVRKNSNFLPLPIKDEKGNWQWFDASYFFPWQNWLGAVDKMSKGDVPGAIKDTGFGNPIFDIAYAISSSSIGRPPKDRFTGQDIYNVNDPSTTKMWKLNEWIFNRWAPSMLTKYGAMGTASQVGELDKYGTKVTAGKAVGKMFGLNIRSLSPKQSAMERSGKEKYLKQELNKIIKDQSIPHDRKVESIKQYISNRKKIYEE